MSSAQKAMKYFAMFLAGCLTICIIATIVNVGVGVLGAFVPKQEVKQENHQKNTKHEEQVEKVASDDQQDFNGIENLEIESSVYKVEIKSDSEIDSVRIERYNIPSSYKVRYNESSKTLETEDDNWMSGIFSRKHSTSKGRVVISVPDNQVLDKVEIEMGVGSVSVEDITVDEMVIECGVGSFSCENVNANYASIDGGVGSVKCDDVSFDGLELSGGVGNIDVSGKITGKTEVSAGMGSLKLKIDGKRDDYNCKVETGLGPVYIDGRKTNDDDSDNNSQLNLLDVEGGIGTIHVDFE